MSWARTIGLLAFHLHTHKIQLIQPNDLNNRSFLGTLKYKLKKVWSTQLQLWNEDCWMVWSTLFGIFFASFRYHSLVQLYSAWLRFFSANTEKIFTYFTFGTFIWTSCTLNSLFGKFHNYTHRHLCIRITRLIMAVVHVLYRIVTSTWKYAGYDFLTLNYPWFGNKQSETLSFLSIIEGNETGSWVK